MKTIIIVTIVLAFLLFLLFVAIRLIKEAIIIKVQFNVKYTDPKVFEKNAIYTLPDGTSILIESCGKPNFMGYYIVRGTRFEEEN